MWTDTMISKDDIAEPGQKAFDFSGGTPKSGQEGQQYNNRNDSRENKMKGKPRLTNVDLSVPNGLEFTGSGGDYPGNAMPT